MHRLRRPRGTPAAEIKASLANATPLLATAEAAASTGQDKLAVGQFAVQIGGIIEDNAVRSRGIRNMLDSGMLEPAEVPLFNFYLGNFAYAAKDWQTATEALTKAVGANISEDAAAEMLAQFLR